MRVLFIATAAALACLVTAGPAQATVRHVHEGQSIQAAIDASSPGDTVFVHRGTYRESLQIDKDRITLRGKRARLLQPAHPGPTLCNQSGDVTGICVVGQGDPNAGTVS